MRVLSTLGVGCLSLCCRLLPARLLLWLADRVGGLGWMLSPSRRAIVDENLRIAFGEDLDSKERKRLGRAACRSLARVVVEIGLAERLLGTPAGAAKRLGFHGDWEQLEQDHAAGRGGVIVTAHLGNWEVGAFAVRHRGVPLRAMARPLGNPALERWLERRRGGAEHLIRKTGGLKDALRTVKAGGWVALLADQNAGRHGVFVPFFGLEASTFPTPAAIAVRLGAPLYLGICLRGEGPACFDVHLERLDVKGAGEGDEAVKALTSGLNARLEGWVRREPGQYNWVHRRWKTRPPGRDRSEPGQPSYARLWPEGHPLTEARKPSPLR